MLIQLQWPNGNDYYVRHRPTHLIHRQLTIKLKKLEQSAVKQQAFKDLLELKRKNGGSNAYGDFEKVKQKYHLKGFTYITVDNLHYRMNNLFKSGNTNLRREIDKPTVLLDVDTDVCDGISPLTVDVVEDVEKPPREEVVKKPLGRPKGTTNETRTNRDIMTDMAYVQVATKFLDMKRKAAVKCRKVPNRCLEIIIEKGRK